MRLAAEAAAVIDAFHAEHACRPAAHVAGPRRRLVAGDHSNALLGRSLDDAAVTHDQLGAGTEVVDVVQTASAQTQDLVDRPGHADLLTRAGGELAEVPAALEPDAPQEAVQGFQLRVGTGRDVQPEHRLAGRLSPHEQHPRPDTAARSLETLADVRTHSGFAGPRSAQPTDPVPALSCHVSPFRNGG